MTLKLIFSSIFALSLATASTIWSPEAINSYEKRSHPALYYHYDSLKILPGRFFYLQRIKWVCDFVSRYQVTDSTSPDYGGVIEAEHLPAIVETDNTQEAIWIWTRWYQLTGRDDYRENIERAWVYLLRHPAYYEHGGNPANVWYAVWNCGLGMWMEMLYRQVYQDSSFKYYSDSCRQFYLNKPLNPANYLENFVTAQSSGMAYEFGIFSNDQELLDTALARGIRVKNWIEAAPRSRLGYQSWAMSGATAFWGVCQTYCRFDTLSGKIWVNIFSESLPGFYPQGTWNCSHNLWLANAYHAANAINHSSSCLIAHRYITDTLLMLDTDLDGGIPATWTDPSTQDQTWVSTYLDFMGMDPNTIPVYEHDLALLNFTIPEPDTIYFPGDTLNLTIQIANAGRTTSPSETLRIFVSGQLFTYIILNPMPFLELETLHLRLCIPETARVINLVATLSGDNNPYNDTACFSQRIHRHCRVGGILMDSVTSQPVTAQIIARLLNRQTIWDSCVTDSCGNFSLNLIDSLFTLTIKPAVPYYRRYFCLAVPRDTDIVLLANPAQVLIINSDTLDTLAFYYTSTLDSLNTNWCYWSIPRNGPVPYHTTSRLQHRTIIWFSGNVATQTIPAQDQDSLIQFGAQGGNLLITGQNIAEELARTRFLEDFVGCRFDSSGWRGFLVMGMRKDSIGRFISGTATAGGNGANNQTSRDVISPLFNSSKFLVYDTTSNTGAGIRRQISSGGRIIFLSFGFEAVNRPPSRPDYFTRVQLMELMLSWLITGTGIEETPNMPAIELQKLHIHPLVFKNELFIITSQSEELQMFDITGRIISQTTTVPDKMTIWRLPQLPTGIYIIKGVKFPDTRVIKISP
uniref:T9SS type A sorting domain-containing protein n=1 Tax=candidate division WOR-3 bacterium TaxID=2052148 RepID=A0A7C1NNL5_UNCW3